MIPIFAIGSVAVSTFAKGNVDLIRYESGKKKESKVTKGTEFYSKDIIKTGKDGKVDIQFENGSKITVYQNGNFYIDSESVTTVVGGKTDNDVNKNTSIWNVFSSKKEKKFKFFEPSGVISTAGVRGTKFTLNTGTDNTESNVKVYEGSVVVSSPGKEDRIVEPLHKYVADNREVVPFNPAEPDPVRSSPALEEKPVILEDQAKIEEETPQISQKEDRAIPEKTKEIPQETKMEKEEVTTVSESTTNPVTKGETYYYKWESAYSGYYIYKCDSTDSINYKCEKMNK